MAQLRDDDRFGPEHCSAGDLARAIGAGTLTARDACEAAIARIEARIPELESAHGNGDDNRVIADVQRTALYVTAFGRQFYEACEYRPEHAR